MSHKHKRNPGSAQDVASRTPVTPTSPAIRRKTIAGIVVLSLASIAVAVYSLQASLRRGAPSGSAVASPRAASTPALAALKASHDFGTISMALGKVSHVYAVSNVTSSPATLVGVSTSCMCTIATVVTARGRSGPFGMAGHGSVPTIREQLAPGESATIEVVFDPAAHGPAGVGRIDRVVTLETAAGEPLQLSFVAMVKP